jgi:hypothetical protein
MSALVAVRTGLLGLPILRLGAREFAGYGYRLGVGRSAGVRAINLEPGAACRGAQLRRCSSRSPAASAGADR